ncbi:MAG: DMT family transporter [Coriobacteriia bacterium]|nr:DMT family transporter [Coriobacteriia bacterium]
MREGIWRYWVQFALVGVAIVWGSTFVVVKDAVTEYPLYLFLALRFAVAVVAFLAIFPKTLLRLSWKAVGAGVFAGLWLCAGYIFQTWGLQGTTASKAAFITGMFVVITPLLEAVLLRHFPAATTWIGVLAAVIGLWLLSGGSAGGWNIGDTSVLMCAFAYAVHMIVLGSVGKRHDVLVLTLVQLATTSVVCAAFALAFEPVGLPSGSVWVALAITGVLGSAAAFAIQTYAQQHIPPARTALILISEPAFGGLFGWLAGEKLEVSGFVGAAFILGGMIIAEVMGARVPADAEDDAAGTPLDAR